MYGQRGVAQFVANHIAQRDGKQYVVVTDFNRGTGSFMDKEHGVVKDGKCRKLVKMIYEPCVKRADDIIEDEQIRLFLYPDGNGDSWRNPESKDITKSNI